MFYLTVEILKKIPKLSQCHDSCLAKQFAVRFLAQVLDESAERPADVNADRLARLREYLYSYWQEQEAL